MRCVAVLTLIIAEAISVKPNEVQNEVKELSKPDRTERLRQLLVARAKSLNEKAQALVAAPKPACKNKKKKARPALLRKAQFDRHCAKGIINTEMTACCQADCGSCDDNSTVCANMAVNGRGSTCCPSVMLATKLPSCEFSHAPCAVPEDVRNPPALDDLKSQEGVRNAAEDCNEVNQAEAGRQLLATHFIKFEGKTVNAETAECGAYGFLKSAVAACDKMDTCMGFGVTAEGKPDCLFIASTIIEEPIESVGTTLYLKRQELSGATFKFAPSAWAKCSESCGGGSTTRTLACKTTLGVSAKLGMCSTQAAMSPAAVPPTEGHCNVFQCSYKNYSFPLDEAETYSDVINALGDDAAMMIPDNTKGPGVANEAVLASTTSAPEEQASPSEPKGVEVFPGVHVYVEDFIHVGEVGSDMMFSTSHTGINWWGEKSWVYKGMVNERVNSAAECFPTPSGATHVLFGPMVTGQEGAMDICEDTLASGLAAEGTGLGYCWYVIAGSTPVGPDGTVSLEDLESSGVLESSGFTYESMNLIPCVKAELFVGKNARVTCDTGVTCPPS